MKKLIVFALTICSSIDLFAQSDDIWGTYFKNNPGSVAVVIGFAVLYFVIKPIYNSITQKENKPMADLTVLDIPFIVYSQPTLESGIVAELKIDDTLQGDPSFIHEKFYKVLLNNGQVGYIAKTCKFKKIS